MPMWHLGLHGATHTLKHSIPLRELSRGVDGSNRSKHRWKKFVKCRWKESVKASMERIYQSVEPRENLMVVDAKGICSPKTKEELGDR